MGKKINLKRLEELPPLFCASYHSVAMVEDASISIFPLKSSFSSRSLTETELC